MVRICGWCKIVLGVTVPDEPGITTGICPKCSEEILIGDGKENQIKFVLSEGERNYLSGLTNLTRQGKITMAPLSGN